MTPTDRYLLEGLSRRLSILKKRTDDALKDDTYVSTIHAFMAGLVVRTLLLLCGQSLFSDWHHWLDSQLCRSAGICDLCHKLKDHPDDVACTECLAEFEKQDRDADIYELMDQPLKGPIS